MNRLRSWWRETSADETGAKIRAGRDERYVEIEANAYRIAARTLPFTMFTAIAVGLIWLPETIGRMAILRLAFLADMLVMGVFLVTARMVMARSGVQLRHPVMARHHMILQAIGFVIVYIGFGFVVRIITGTSTSRGSTIFWAIYAGAINFGVLAWRSHRSDTGSGE